MQTFLPYLSLKDSVKCLDYQRLGKQRVEAFQIWKTLRQGSAWARHPAVNMWRNFEGSLMCYHDACIAEWKARGFKNNMARFFETSTSLDDIDHLFRLSDAPPWFGDERFHASHRSNLLRKDPAHYGQFGWKESSDLPYFWPTKEKEYQNNHLHAN